MAPPPPNTRQQALAPLKRMGFAVVRIHGSHHHLYHWSRKVVVTVPVHSGETLAPKTLKSILTQAGVSLDSFIQQL